MHCAEFQRRWNKILDERQRPSHDEALQNHALTCASCRELLLGEAQLHQLLTGNATEPYTYQRIDALDDSTLLEVPVAELLPSERRCPSHRSSDFASLVVAQVIADFPLAGCSDDRLTVTGKRDEPPSRARHARHISLAIVVAATIFVIVIPLGYRMVGRWAVTLSPPEDVQRQGIPARPPAAARGMIAAWRGPSPGVAREAETSQPPLAVTSQPPSGAATAERYSSGPQSIERPHSPAPIASSPNGSDPDELRRVMRELWARIPEVTSGPLEPIDRIAGGIWPIASTLGAAWEALRRSIPDAGDIPPGEPQAQWQNSERPPTLVGWSLTHFT